MSGGIAPSQGPRYGISSVNATHAPNRIARLEAAGQPADRAEQPEREARAGADDQRHEHLALDVAAD